MTHLKSETGPIAVSAIDRSGSLLPVDRPVPGGRCDDPQRAAATPRSHVGLLGDLQRVVDLDAEVAHGALDLRMPQ